MNNQTTSRKLALHRETLRTLGADDLEGVAGGKDTATYSAGIGPLAKAMADASLLPGRDQPGYNHTVYHGGGKVIPT